MQDAIHRLKTTPLPGPAGPRKPCANTALSCAQSNSEIPPPLKKRRVSICAKRCVIACCFGTSVVDELRFPFWTGYRTARAQNLAIGLGSVMR